MRNKFNPEDLKSFDGMIAHILSNGSAFVSISNEEQVYVPSRLLDGKNVDTGDGLRCWCVPNLPEHAATARWRALRCMVTKRLSEVSNEEGPMAVPLASLQSDVEASGTNVAPEEQDAPEAEVYEPAPKVEYVTLMREKLRARVDAVLDEMKVVSAKDVYTSICQETPALWKDPKLLHRVTDCLINMAAAGDAACARLYSSTDQTGPSAVYFARNIEIITISLRGGNK